MSLTTTTLTAPSNRTLLLLIENYIPWITLKQDHEHFNNEFALPQQQKFHEDRCD